MVTVKKDPIIDVLRHARVRQKITQKQIAAATGVSTRTIGRIESGQADMTLNQYRLWIECLGLSDLDVSLSLFNYDVVTAKDIEAASRRLPLKVRRLVLRFLLDLPNAMK